jgi:CspA family cold shock protein
MAQGQNGRMCGKVKWFNAAKGYGFISPEGSKKDVFVHYSGIDADGYRELQQDQAVEFEIEQSDRGPKAVNVRVVG